MTKSPRAVAREALRLAREALPAYSSARSRKDFTQHQLFAVLALKTFFKTDYRGVVAVLDDFAELRADLGLTEGARTTRPCATPSQRLLKRGGFVVLLLRATTSAADRGLIGEKPTAAVDATGLESRHTSRYFFKRAGRKHTSRLWTKLTVAVRHRQPLLRRGHRHHRPVQRLPAIPPGHGPGVPGRHLGPGAGRRRLRQRGPPPLRPRGPRGPRPP